MMNVESLKAEVGRLVLPGSPVPPMSVPPRWRRCGSGPGQVELDAKVPVGSLSAQDIGKAPIRLGVSPRGGLHGGLRDTFPGPTVDHLRLQIARENLIHQFTRPRVETIVREHPSV
jgi:hypothetical protein